MRKIKISPPFALPQGTSALESSQPLQSILLGTVRMAFLVFHAIQRALSMISKKRLNSIRRIFPTRKPTLMKQRTLKSCWRTSNRCAFHWQLLWMWPAKRKRLSRNFKNYRLRKLGRKRAIAYPIWNMEQRSQHTKSQLAACALRQLDIANWTHVVATASTRVKHALHRSSWGILEIRLTNSQERYMIREVAILQGLFLRSRGSGTSWDFCFRKRWRWILKGTILRNCSLNMTRGDKTIWKIRACV